MHWNSLWDNNSLYVTCKQRRRVHSTQDLDMYTCSNQWWMEVCVVCRILVLFVGCSPRPSQTHGPCQQICLLQLSASKYVRVKFLKHILQLHIMERNEWEWMGIVWHCREMPLFLGMQYCTGSYNRLTWPLVLVSHWGVVWKLESIPCWMTGPFHSPLGNFPQNPSNLWKAIRRPNCFKRFQPRSSPTKKKTHLDLNQRVPQIFMVETIHHLFVCKDLHPGRLTWNLTIHPWKRKNIFQTIMFRFHATLWGCS